MGRRSETMAIVWALWRTRDLPVEPEAAGRIETLEEVRAEEASLVEAEVEAARLEAGVAASRDGRNMIWEQLSDIVAGACFLLASFLTVAAGMGMKRFRGLLGSIHAAAKPQAL